MCEKGTVIISKTGTHRCLVLILNVDFMEETTTVSKLYKFRFCNLSRYMYIYSNVD